MTRAAELIVQALLPRKAAPMLERHTGLPYGWGLWLRGLPARLGVISRDKAESIVQGLMLRSPPPQGTIVPALGFWRGLRALFYQQWEPPPREERGLRWLAGSVSLLMHLLFVLLLIWVAVVRLPPLPSAGDSSRVQVEYIGKGTPDEPGGGAPDAAASAAAASPSVRNAAAAEPPQRALPEFVPPAPALTAEVPAVREREIAEPAPTAPQTVQVTETPVPTIEYVLPPPTLRREAVTAPAITPREMSVPTREVTVVETPAVPRVDVQRGLAVPQIQRPVQEVREREVAAPLPQVRTAQVPSRPLPAPELQAPAVGVREREIPTPSRAPGTGRDGTASTQAPRPQQGSGSSTATTASSPSPHGNQPAATASGPAAADRAGAWPAPVRGDDWGASQRNVAGDSGANAGQKPGLFNADGSIRVPEGTGQGTADRGAPGGANDQWTREQIDRSGTWLQRPPYDYEPTSFDKYWVPNESLLAEWVRRNIREAVIPIPGTGKKIRCVVSVLQLGGGCGLFDPNLNEQPASARPPPGIPVKRTPIPTDS